MVTHKHVHRKFWLVPSLFCAVDSFFMRHQIDANFLELLSFVGWDTWHTTCELILHHGRSGLCVILF